MKSPLLFVSYVREDGEEVDELASALRLQGLTVWKDNHIGAGDEWATRIDQKIREADVFIACFSDSFSARGGRTYMFQEFKIALEQHQAGRLKLIVPVLLSECTVADLKDFSGIQAVPYFAAKEKAVSKLLDAIEAKFPWKRKDLTMNRNERILFSAILVIAGFALLLLGDRSKWSWWAPTAIASAVIGPLTLGTYTILLFRTPRERRRPILRQDGGYPYVLCILFNLGWFIVSTVLANLKSHHPLTVQNLLHLGAQTGLLIGAISAVTADFPPLIVFRIDQRIWRWSFSILLVLLANGLALFDSHYQHHLGLVNFPDWNQWRWTNFFTIWAYLAGAILVIWTGRLKKTAIGAFVISLSIFIYLIVTTLFV